MTAPEIAIVAPNTLTSLGLQNLLEEIIPMATIRVFRSFAELMDDTPDMPQLSGVPTLNIYQDEKGLVKDILQLHRYGHQHGHPDKQPDGLRSAMPPHAAGNADAHELSAREIEVLVLITKGLINKEIADKLNISLTTVITHRKNIVEKLGIKSVSGLTIYAVMHGYIDADRI